MRWTMKEKRLRGYEGIRVFFDSKLLGLPGLWVEEATVHRVFLQTDSV